MLTPRRTSRSGAAAVEFAAVLPVLCIMLVGLWEIGRLVQVTQIVDNAAREGGRLAASGAWTSSASHPSMNSPSTSIDYEVQRKVLIYLNNAGLNTNMATVSVANNGSSTNSRTISAVTYPTSTPSNYSTAIVNYSTSTIVGNSYDPSSFSDPAVAANPTTYNATSGGTFPVPDQLVVTVTIPYSSVSWSPMNWFVSSSFNISCTVYWDSVRNTPLYFSTTIPTQVQ